MSILAYILFYIVAVVVLLMFFAGAQRVSNNYDED